MTSDVQGSSQVFCTQCGAAVTAGSRFCGACGAPAGPRAVSAQPVSADVSGTMEGWLSIGIGVVLILISPRIWGYLFTGSTSWTFSDADGSPLPYSQTVYFWGDIALALFSVVLIVEGLILAFARKAPFVAFAFGLTVLAIALNAGYIVYMMTKGYGFQFISGLATVFGVYIAVQQWALLQSLRTHVAQRA